MLHKPNSVVICGIPYKIIYTDKASEVDVYKRRALWGQIDYWTRTIRIYDDDQPIESIWNSLFHEILHGIVEELHIKSLEFKEETDQNHLDLDTLSSAIVDTLFRNGWIDVTKG